MIGVLKVSPTYLILRENTPFQNLADESFETFNIFRSHKNETRRVIITAHGKQTFRNSYARLERGQSIRYYRGEGRSIVADTLNLAHNDYLPRETLNGPGRIRNYSLSHYELDVDARLKRIVNRTGVDIISITKNTNLNNVIEVINSRGFNYKIIDGSFCRNRWIDTFFPDESTQNAYMPPF
ncbi:hypothetical protein Q8V88_003993 [Enterobacter hormaechei]|nr:hypothetical protein [Enterobacter hormaechei]